MTTLSPYRRDEIADHIVASLEHSRDVMHAAFQSPDRIASCFVDDVLPKDLAKEIFAVFPPNARMMFKTSLKERKYVAAQMDAYHPLLEEAVFAFQDQRVSGLVGEITGLQAMEPDSNLYAGGISAMAKGGYLKPHLDNSHDGGRARYRVLNLLYYITPDWREADGGNLQLWDHGPRGEARTISSLFNRLVLMITNRTSWHSVSEVRGAGVRCCVSNYYFSPRSPDARDYFHATSFRGEPGEHLTDAVMRADNRLRTTLLKTLGEAAYKNPHVYKRRVDDSEIAARAEASARPVDAANPFVV